jgi:glycerophosphoryl diester phosphodiesterase
MRGAKHRPQVVAHRGSSEARPEHTLGAYLAALDEGADALECDVRLTADGQLVCWHDPDVDRTSDGRGPVHEHTLEQLRALDLTSGRAADLPTSFGGPDEQLLTLDELITLARGAGRPIQLAIELKHPVPYGFAAEDAVLEVLEAIGWDPGTGLVDGDRGPGAGVTVSLMSFHPGSLQHLGTFVPSTHLMALTDEVDVSEQVDTFAPGLADSPLVLAGVQRLVEEARLMIDDLQVAGAGPSVAYLRAHPEKVRRWVAAGTLVRVWTVDTAEDLALCQEIAVPEVTTNRPAEILALLGG